MQQPAHRMKTPLFIPHLKPTKLLRSTTNYIQSIHYLSTFITKPTHTLTTHRQSQTLHRTSLHVILTKMSSDDAYASFLEKANQDTGYNVQSSGTPQTRSASAKATTANHNTHPALQSVNEYYTSDTDEPFEPVSFPYDGGEEELSESTFCAPMIRMEM